MLVERPNNLRKSIWHEQVIVIEFNQQFSATPCNRFPLRITNTIERSPQMRDALDSRIVLVGAHPNSATVEVDDPLPVSESLSQKRLITLIEVRHVMRRCED